MAGQRRVTLLAYVCRRDRFPRAGSPLKRERPCETDVPQISTGFYAAGTAGDTRAR